MANDINAFSRVTTHSGTSFSQFDWKHWNRVKAERRRLGIQSRSNAGELVEHPLVGKTVIDRTTGKEYVVERVRKDWLRGWFLYALLNHDSSHRTCFVENRSSVSLDVLNGLQDFNENFVVAE